MVESLVQPEEPTTEPEPVSAHIAPTAVGRTSAVEHIEYLTAETERGRQAIWAVMDRSYCADWEGLPPGWTLARLVDGVPVSFIVVDPDKELAIGRAAMRYAFVNDVATRTDRRREGHFRALMEYTCDRLRQDGVSLLLLHGRYPLYRPLGFDVFTHHCGIFLTPTQIERVLGPGDGTRGRGLLQVEDRPGVQADLLLVTEVRAESLAECTAALRAAAALARERDKTRILCEHPPAPCGTSYETYASPETPFTSLARTCGAEVRLQGADPESGAIPDADWIKVLDAPALVAEFLACHSEEARVYSFPPCSVRGGLKGATLALDTEAGAVTLIWDGHRVAAQPGIVLGAHAIRWPASALAQLVTGYRSAETLALLHCIQLPPEAQALLSAIFPTCWRFSRNESWTYTS